MPPHAMLRQCPGKPVYHRCGGPLFARTSDAGDVIFVCPVHGQIARTEIRASRRTEKSRRHKPDDA